MKTHLDPIICKRILPYTLTEMFRHYVKVMQSLEDQNMVFAACNLKGEFSTLIFLWSILQHGKAL